MLARYCAIVIIRVHWPRAIKPTRAVIAALDTDARNLAPKTSVARFTSKCSITALDAAVAVW